MQVYTILLASLGIVLGAAKGKVIILNHGNRKKEYHLISVAVFFFVCPIDCEANTKAIVKLDYASFSLFYATFDIVTI